MGCGTVIVAVPCPSVNGSCFGEYNVRDIDKSCCEVGSQVWCGSCDDLCSWGAAVGGRLSAGAPHCSVGIGDWGWEIEP